MMNKKGFLIFEIAIWIMRIILVIIIIAGISLQIRSYIDTRVNLYFAEPALIMQIIGNSPSFLYQDASGSYQRMISVERFETAEQLLNAEFFYRQPRYAAAKVALIEKNGAEIKSILLNPDYYNELAAQIQLLSGKTVDVTEREWTVTLVQKGKERQGILRVEVLQPT